MENLIFAAVEEKRENWKRKRGKGNEKGRRGGIEKRLEKTKIKTQNVERGAIIEEDYHRENLES
jgi:hypothetical protein